MSWAHTHVERVRFGDLDGVLVGYDYEAQRTAPLPDALEERLR